jgi:quercetin dioxygenase-like cupin family protein
MFRLVEFNTEFIEKDWCTKGHTGFLIGGEMELNINGDVKNLKAGDALTIPAGCRHKHHSTIQTSKLFLIEEV